MKYGSLIDVVVALFSLARAQPDTAWARIYEDTTQYGDEATAIAVDDSGNVYVAGCSHGTGTDHAFLAIKYRPDGDTAWVRTWNPTTGRDEANAMALDRARNMILTGYCGSYSAEGGDWATVKFSPAGESLWAQTFDYGTQDEARALAVDATDDVYVTGQLGGNNSYVYGTTEYNPTGETLWTRQYSAPLAATNVPLAAALDRQGNLLVTGFSTASDRNVATVKYTPQGDTVWARAWDGPRHRGAYGSAIASDDANNVCVAGFCLDSSGHDQNLIVKYSAGGDTLWARTGGPPGSNSWAEIYALAVSGPGSIFATGQCSTDGGNYWDIATAKLWPNGDTAWTARYNATGYGSEVGRAIAVDSSGNVYVVGQSLGSGTGYDAVTLKYDSLGHLLWVARFPGPSNWSDARALALGRGGTVAVGGKANTPDGFGGALTILYAAGGAVAEVPAPHAQRVETCPTIVRNVLRISPQLAARSLRLGLYDIEGRRVLDIPHFEFRTPHSIDVSRLAPGVYFVRSVENGQRSAVLKIVMTR